MVDRKSSIEDIATEEPVGLTDVEIVNKYKLRGMVGKYAMYELDSARLSTQQRANRHFHSFVWGTLRRIHYVPINGRTHVTLKFDVGDLSMFIPAQAIVGVV